MSMQDNLTGYEPTAGRIGVSINTHVFTGKADDWSNWSFLYESLITQAGWSDLLEDAENSLKPQKAEYFLSKKPNTQKEEEVSVSKEESESEKDKPTPGDKMGKPIASKAQRDLDFYFHLVGSIRGDALHEARKTKERKGTLIWALLLKKYRLINASRKTALYGKFFHNDNHMSDDENIDVFLARIEDQQRQLADLNVNLTEEAVLNVIKNGLTDDFSSVIQFMNMVSDEIPLDKAVEWIREAGRDLEARRKRGSEREKDSAFFAKKTFKGKCHKCSKIGHKSADCRSSGAARGKGDKKQAKCDYCSKVGHTAEKCYKRQREEGKETSFMARDYAYGARDVLDESASVTFVVDSGCTRHMTNSELGYQKSEDIQREVTVASGAMVKAKEQGIVRMSVGVTNVKLDPVLLIPGLNDKLMSVIRVTKNGNTVVLRSIELPHGSSHICTSDGTKIPINTETGMYRLNGVVLGGQDMAATATTSDPKDVMLWHKRLGHVCVRTLREMGVVGPGSALVFCRACALAKSKKAPQNREEITRSFSNGQMFHSDMSGPYSPQTQSGMKYSTMIVDDRTGYQWLFLTKGKDTFDEKFDEFLGLEIKPKGYKPVRLHTDGGGEYCGAKVRTLLKREGIKPTHSPPGNPECNGRAEAALATAHDQARAMLLESGLAPKHWGAAMLAIVHVRNRLPSPRDKEHGRSPYELWTGHKPDLKKLRVFGCKCYIHVYTSRTKFAPKAEEGIFLGYDKLSGAYIVEVARTKALRVSKSVKFDEGHELDMPTSDEIAEHEPETENMGPLLVPKAETSETPQGQGEQGTTFEGTLPTFVVPTPKHPKGKVQSIEQTPKKQSIVLTDTPSTTTWTEFDSNGTMITYTRTTPPPKPYRRTSVSSSGSESSSRQTITPPTTPSYSPLAATPSPAHEAQG